MIKGISLNTSEQNFGFLDEKTLDPTFVTAGCLLVSCSAFARSVPLSGDPAPNVDLSCEVLEPGDSPAPILIPFSLTLMIRSQSIVAFDGPDDNLSNISVGGASFSSINQTFTLLMTDGCPGEYAFQLEPNVVDTEHFGRDCPIGGADESVEPPRNYQVTCTYQFAE
jgi:hypothetical protein